MEIELQLIVNDDSLLERWTGKSLEWTVDIIWRQWKVAKCKNIPAGIKIS